MEFKCRFSQFRRAEFSGIVGGGWQIAGTGDFNGASEAGILWRNASGDTELWNANGSGGFIGQDLGVVPTSWRIAGTGDFGGAGKGLLDGAGEGILWRNANGDTELWNANGSGGFAGDDLGVVPTSWQIAGTGDFTGTGKDSILWRNANGDTELWNPNGSGGFVGDDLGVVPTSWQIAGTGDFTGNGKDSILWRNANGDTELWNPAGSGGFVGKDFGVVPTSWQIAGTGDFGGTGKDSILWRNANGDTELWNRQRFRRLHRPGSRRRRNELVGAQDFRLRHAQNEVKGRSLGVKETRTRKCRATLPRP